MANLTKKNIGNGNIKTYGPTLGNVISPEKTILIERKYGGVGDILMQRPLFIEIKKRNPHIITHFSLPEKFIPLVLDLEDIDAIIPFESKPDKNSYGWYGDISTACINHEIIFKSKVFENRSDIWAKHLGINLSSHSAKISLTKDEILWSKKYLEEMHISKKIMIISPYSADKTRNLSNEHIDFGICWAIKNDYFPILLHSHEVEEFKDKVLQIHSLSLRQWMAIVSNSHLCLTTDTGALHLAGYMAIPTVAIFNHTSADVVAKHYDSVIGLQLSKSQLECVPCYNWGNCKFFEDGKQKIPLRCMSEISFDMLNDALHKAKEKSFKIPNVNTIENLNYEKILTNNKINFEIKEQEEKYCIWKEDFINIICNSSYENLFMALIISNWCKSHNRNININIIFPRETMFTSHYCKILSSTKQINNIENSKILDISNELNLNVDIYYFFMNKFGIDIMSVKNHVNIPNEYMNQSDSFVLVDKGLNIDTDDLTLEIDEDWPVELLYSYVAKSKEIYSSKTLIMMMAIFSGNLANYYGDNKILFSKIGSIKHCK